MATSLDAAAAAMRDAMRDTVRRYSLWYLVQGILMVVIGVFALISPWTASAAIVRLLGWFLIISGVLQGIGLIGARRFVYWWSSSPQCSPSLSACCCYAIPMRDCSSSACS